MRSLQVILLRNLYKKDASADTRVSKRSIGVQMCLVCLVKLELETVINMNVLCYRYD